MRALLVTVVVLLALAVPRLALACPVCFGESDAPLAQAINQGILAMLVVVAGVLGSFAAFFIYLVRRARALDAAASAGGASEGHAESRTQEGTVRC